MKRVLLDDELWGMIEPFLPEPKPRRFRHPGRKPITHRKTLTGILFVLRSGIPWEMLPQEMGCGSGVTCWRRLRDWQACGVWEKVHRKLLRELRHRGMLDLSVAVIDSGTIRAVGVGSHHSKKQAPIPPIAVGQRASTILSPTPRAIRSWQHSRARINMTRLNCCL